MQGKPTTLYLLGKADDRYKPKWFHASQRGRMRRTSMFLCLLLVFVSPVVWSQGPRSTKKEKPEINGQGTPGTLSKFTGSTQIGNSIVIESNGGVQVGGNIEAQIDIAPGIAIVGTNNTTAGSAEMDATFNSGIRGIQAQTFSPAGVAVEALALSDVGDPIGILGITATSTGRGIGVRGQAANPLGNGIGVLGEAAGQNGVAVLGNAVAPNGDPMGVLGVANSADRGIGVRGAAKSATGTGIGVLGEAESPDGTAVFGNGVRVGVRGITRATSGFTEPISGTTYSPDGAAAVFRNPAGGTLIAGQGINNVQTFRVDANGTVFANGGFQPFGADFAESMAVKGDRSRYEPGDVLAIDRSGQRRLAVADSPYSTFVAGIYSTKPGVLASPYAMVNPNLAKEVPMAVVGIVPCKVSAENGAIETGDLLVASSTPGHAMRGTDRTKMLGAVIGKALQPLQNGKGVIQVLVTLQ